MHLKWSNEFLFFVIFLIPLLVMGYLVLRANDKEKARDERMAEDNPGYAEWKQLNDKWHLFVWVPGSLVMVSEDLVSGYAILKPVLGWVIPVVFYSWAPMVICAMLVHGSRYRNWRSYLIAIWRPVLMCGLVASLYWHDVHLIADGLIPAVKWVQFLVGVALSPMLLRLSGFLELDKFEPEPALKSVIPEPTGREQ